MRKSQPQRQSKVKGVVTPGKASCRFSLERPETFDIPYRESGVKKGKVKWGDRQTRMGEAGFRVLSLVVC